MRRREPITRTYPTVLVVLVALVTVIGFIPMGASIAPGEPGGPVTVQQGTPVDEVGETCRLIFAEVWCGLLEDALGDASDEIEGACPTVLAQAWCSLVEGAVEPPSCASHPPIRVTENAGEEGFVLVEGTPTYRPGSGVIAGLGTEANPYVIAGWCIDGSDESWDELGVAPDQPEGIWIQDTDAHVVIKGMNVTGHPGSGVRWSNVENMALETSTITGNEDHGVDVDSSRSSQLSNNTITDNGLSGVVLAFGSHGFDIMNNNLTGNTEAGVYSHISFDNRVEGNTIRDAGLAGVYLSSSHDTRLEGNTITDNQAPGVKAVISDSNQVRENTITGNTVGVALQQAAFNQVHGNTIAKNDQHGASLFFSDLNWVEANTITDNGAHGVSLSVSSDTSVNGNTIEANGLVGLLVSGGSLNTQINENVIHGNAGDGILISGGSLGTPSGTLAQGNNIMDNHGSGLLAVDHIGNVDVPFNWWGHSSGPSGGITDACTGTTTNGQGQSIQTSSASVCFDPWLSNPNANAGAD